MTVGGPGLRPGLPDDRAYSPRLSLTERWYALPCGRQLIYTRSRRTAPRVPCPVLAGNHATTPSTSVRLQTANPLFDQVLAKHLEAPQSEDREAFDSSSAHACAEPHAPVSRSLCGRRRDAAGRTLTWSGSSLFSLQGERLGGVGRGALLFAIKVSYCSGSPLPVCASFFF